MLKTRIVSIGDLLLGGDNPIRLQSMTNTNTLDTMACMEQVIRIFEAGGELVRLTTQGISEAENLGEIKKVLSERGFHVPLIADVHFNPTVAEAAARFVEKVRINPGNYADKKQFHNIDYTNREYADELERIHNRILPLIAICKQYGTAIRIGVNHGSLSDRIMSRYGDTPAGMVQSAIEFLNIFKAEGFHNLVMSMKSSNTRVMLYAARLLYYQMQKDGDAYPIHLGVTEAGEGEDGRLKSAAGIGALLAEGIGDTIRVSLTEAPELEILVAKKLVQEYPRKPDTERTTRFIIRNVNPVEYKRHLTNLVGDIGGSKPPVIIADAENKDLLENNLEPFPEFIYLLGSPVLSYSESGIRFLRNWYAWMEDPAIQKSFLPLIPPKAYLEGHSGNVEPRFIFASTGDIEPHLISKLSKDPFAVLVLQSFANEPVRAMRKVFEELDEKGCHVPVILNFNFSEDDIETLQVKSAAAFGALLLDGLGDGIWIRNAGKIAIPQIYSIAKGILQACRMRTYRTEYIACPSCGRTLFNIAETLHQIKQKTSHLVHLKIAVMGCIVNGPSEMADADYGYVGAGPGKVTLYKGKEVVKKNIPSENAVDELVALIQIKGDWIEP